MILNVRGGRSGWREYVRRNRKDELVEEVGNINLTKSIYEGLKYKQKYTKVLLAFSGKVSNEVLKEAYEDFIKMYLIDSGLDESEFNISGMIHQDTTHSHIHICIPEVNLQTNTKLTVYNDIHDKKRLMLIQDIINKKYDDKDPRKHRKAKKFDKVAYINKQRELLNQSLLKIDYKDRSQKLTAYENTIEEMIEAGNIHSYDDIVQFLEDDKNPKKIVNEGYNEYEKYHFITVEETVKGKKKKMKLKGEFFNKDYKFKDVSIETSTARIHNLDLETSYQELSKLNSYKQKHNAKRYKNQSKYKEDVQETEMINNLNLMDSSLSNMSLTSFSLRRFKSQKPYRYLKEGKRLEKIMDKLKSYDTSLNRIARVKIDLTSYKKNKENNLLINEQKINSLLENLNTQDVVLKRLSDTKVSIKNFKEKKSSQEYVRRRNLESNLLELDQKLDAVINKPIDASKVKNKIIRKRITNGYINRKVRKTDNNLRESTEKIRKTNRELRSTEQSFKSTDKDYKRSKQIITRAEEQIRETNRELRETKQSFESTNKDYKRAKRTITSSTSRNNEIERGIKQRKREVYRKYRTYSSGSDYINHEYKTIRGRFEVIVVKSRKFITEQIQQRIEEAKKWYDELHKVENTKLFDDSDFSDDEGNYDVDADIDDVLQELEEEEKAKNIEALKKQTERNTKKILKPDL